MDWQQAALRDVNGISQYFCQKVEKHRTQVLRQMDSLRQRPDALSRTKEVAFYDSWTSDSHRSFGGFTSVIGRSAEELLLPMLSRLCFFIFRCPLEAFSFSSYEFIGVLWDAVCSNPTLRTLSVKARLQEDTRNWYVTSSVALCRA